jgi:hypothetical protein
VLISPFAAACHFLIPWDAHYYPGIGRGLRQLAGNRVGTATALKWRKANPAPLWAMELLAEEIGRQARLGLKVEEALRTQIEAKKATPRKPRGVEIIAEETGLPKYRNRVGHKWQPDREV